MGPIGGGGVWGESENFGHPPPKNYWATFTKFKYIVGNLSSSPIDWHPFWANWVMVNLTSGVRWRAGVEEREKDQKSQKESSQSD